VKDRMGLIAFASGKRIRIDPVAREITVTGAMHVDTYSFDKASSRVKFYERLAQKHRARPENPYAASLEAARKAAQMAAEASA